jgi:hypothetical protein
MKKIHQHANILLELLLVRRIRSALLAQDIQLGIHCSQAKLLELSAASGSNGCQ